MKAGTGTDKNKDKPESSVTGGKITIPPEMVSRFRQGDHQSFEKLFLLLYPRVIAFIQSIIKDRDQAEELTQQLFVDLWIEREKVDPEKNISAYIYTMARNSTLTAIKRQLRFEPVEFDYDRETESRMTDDQLIAKETQLLIDMIVATMPPKRREVYELSRYDHLDNDEIAEKLNISRKVVEKHIRLAINDLKKNIDLII